jgi:hypothetical protein
MSAQVQSKRKPGCEPGAEATPLNQRKRCGAEGEGDTAGAAVQGQRETRFNVSSRGAKYTYSNTCMNPMVKMMQVTCARYLA